MGHNVLYEIFDSESDELSQDQKAKIIAFAESKNFTYIEDEGEHIAIRGYHSYGYNLGADMQDNLKDIRKIEIRYYDLDQEPDEEFEAGHEVDENAETGDN